MRIPIHIFNASVVNGTFTCSSTPVYLGYAEVERFDPENVWDLCNWGHWSTERPKTLYADISSCTHGLMLYHPEKREYWLALSNGWLSGSKEDITAYVEQHKYDIWWGKDKEEEEYE